MDPNIKKELFGVMASLFIHLFDGGEEEETFVIDAASEIFKTPHRPSKVKEKNSGHEVKANTMTSKDKLKLREQSYLRISRFEKVVDPILQLIPESDLCVKTLKSIKDICLCSCHYKEDANNLSIVVKQTGGSILSDMDFKAQWKMNRSTVEAVYCIINQMNPELPVTPMELLSVLWVMVAGETILDTSKRFQLTTDKIHAAHNIVMERLIALRPQHERWPIGNVVNIVAEAFYNMTGFNSIIGCIAAVHFKCKKPPFNPNLFTKAPGTPTVAFQLICDHRGTFINSSYHFWPGGRLPQQLYKASKINVPFPENSFLLGKNGYSNVKTVLTPYAPANCTRHLDFNARHTKGFSPMKNAVGSLLSRFRILQSLPTRHSSYIRQTVGSCLILHNIVLDMEDEMDLELVPDEISLPSYSIPVKNVNSPNVVRRDELSLSI